MISPVFDYIVWMLVLPLAAFVVLGIFGRRYLKNVSGLIGTGVILAVTIIAFVTAWQYFLEGGKINGVFEEIVVFKFRWLEFTPVLRSVPGWHTVPDLSIDISAVLHPVSVMMLVVVSFVSLMVHIFSIWYMKGEERFATYYSYLSLFTFSMLGLVLAGNIFQVYIFWELVGVSSFLLIGYYFNKPSAVSAAKKAFIITRFADLGFLIGILVLGFYGGSFDIGALADNLSATDNSFAAAYRAPAAGFLGISSLTWGLILVFIGGAGKSAMFPLHVWLPDAMEGPTPVSALIHAATMVVAGVFLVARLFPLFSTNAAVMDIVTWTGAFSALLAAVIACTQTDIKRVLAYSTMSQIGYMMFALGISKSGGEEGLGYMASMFHLFTHAFFKSLLFLCAGAIIHAVHSNDMADMGGLRKQLPLTHFCSLVGCLAISGIPPFAGFFSKEEILLAAYHKDKLMYAIGLFTALLTAFYMFRFYFSIFWKKEPQHQLHGEGALAMKLPLLLLVLCTAGAGFVPFSSWVTADGRPLDTHMNLAFSIAPVGVSIVAILFAMRLYRKDNDLAARIASGFGGIYRAAYRKFYIDEVYLFITKKIIFPYVGKPAAWIDRHVVDGAVNMAANVTGGISGLIKGMQSGKLQSYALYFFGGVMALMVLFIYLWK